MKKPKFPLWIVFVLAALVGGLVAISTLNNKNVHIVEESEHEHEHDNK